MIPSPTTDFTLTGLDNQGAAGSRGLDFAFTAPQQPNANFVLAGYTKADLAPGGRLSVTFGTNPAQNGLPASDYFDIQAR